MKEENIPELSIDGPAIKGWEEVKEWGILNHPTWHSTHRIAEQQNLTETQTLRLLTYQLLKQNVRLFENLTEAVSQQRVVYIEKGALP